ncbi:hypothetical protein Tco_0352442 [Tanacetum coccineum]
MGGCGGDEGGSHGCGMVAVVAESDGGGKGAWRRVEWDIRHHLYVVGMENEDSDGDGTVNGGVGYGEVIVKRENGDEELCSVLIKSSVREASTAVAAPKCCLSNLLVLKEVSHYCLGTRMICTASIYFVLLMQDLMLPVVISYVNAAIDTTAIGFKRRS